MKQDQPECSILVIGQSVRHKRNLAVTQTSVKDYSLIPA